MHNEFMAFVCDEDSLSTSRAWAERQGFPQDTVQSGGAETFVTMLEADSPPKLAIVDFDNLEQPVQMAARLVSLCGPASKIVAIGSANDVGLYRNMIASGLTDYIVKPITAEMMTQTMLQASRGPASAKKDAKIVVMIGVRGGAGTSTIAVNTGWIVAHELKQKCALLDLDLQFGTSSLALDLEPGHGLRDIVSSPQRVDNLMIAGAVINESDNFSILSAEEAIDENMHIDGSAITALMKEMRPNYNAIIIDLPRNLMPTQKRLLAIAHEIVLVTEMTLAGIRDTLRARTSLKSLGYPARVTLVASKVGPQRPAAVDETTFAKGAQAKVDFIIPDDHKNINLASNSGKMLGALAADSVVTKTIRSLAKHLMAGALDDINDRDGKSEAGGWFKGFFGGGKKSGEDEDGYLK